MQTRRPTARLRWHGEYPVVYHPFRVIFSCDARHIRAASRRFFAPSFSRMYGTKRNYGREYEGVIRSTFIIDPAGSIAKVFSKVKTDTHGTDVLKWLEGNTR